MFHDSKLVRSDLTTVDVSLEIYDFLTHKGGGNLPPNSPKGPPREDDPSKEPFDEFFKVDWKGVLTAAFFAAVPCLTVGAVAKEVAPRVAHAFQSDFIPTVRKP